MITFINIVNSAAELVRILFEHILANLELTDLLFTKH